ncbi:MAG TPA: hypothetical protein VKI61_14960 [Chitinophagaceae bacterium]|jgi:hypothetical protein|nr:hypothetical protein [Chitinophagaceae bacterium]
MCEESGFLIKANDGHFRLKILELPGFPETFFWGGYDTKSYAEIHAQNFSANAEIYISTYEIYKFYIQLNDCYNSLKGNAVLTSYEKNLNLILSFDELGHVNIKGDFRAEMNNDTKLTFELSGDQSFLPATLNSLKRITDKYGNQYGNK